ncbi:MAG: siroheme synthase CysG [Pseudomonadales bacterium]
MDHLPLYLSLNGRRVLLIGAGEVALRKLETLGRAGAVVQVVALQVSAAVAQLAAQAGHRLSERAFAPEDLDHCWLVVSACGDAEVNQQLVRLCDARQIWLNVVDETPACSAIFPAIVDRDPLLVAISTGGRSPTLARYVRGLIEERLPQGLADLAQFIGQRREKVTAALPGVSERQQFWQRFLALRPLAQWLAEIRQTSADEPFERLLSSAQASSATQPLGHVALIGGGPGDPELITLRGLNLIRQADVIFYDNLVNQQLLDNARRDAEKIYVGKKRAFKGIRQEEINALLITQARLGKQVVRLKGGDPFIFGRGGEEIAQLAQQHIPFTVVPGISAALGGASSAGIPLTHRDASQSVRFITGHRASDRANLDWPELAKPEQTLVIYMGLPALADILQALITHGLAESTPAALIEKATLPNERVIIGTVADLSAKVTAAAVVGPTLIIVGEVVAHRVVNNPS